MKLNKFLVAAAAVAVLPLSVANAEEPAPKPETSNGPAPLVNKGDYAEKGPALVNEVPAYGEKLVKPEVNDVPEFKGGVNGTEAAVLDKPEYKAPKSQGTFKVDKGTEAGKAQNGQKVLPKTSAVK